MSEPPPLTATIVITTKNRKAELRSALKSAVAQRGDLEILVMDDGSTDGTSDLVAAEFPGVRVERVQEPLGLIVQRNRAACLARGEIIFSIDDDAVFSTPDVVQQTLAEFSDPRVGAVAIPFINVNKENVLLQRAPDSNAIYCMSDYIGTAHAVRRSLFNRLGGYRAYLFHQGEERDYCIRMLDAGYVVRLGSADAIHHFESPKRDFRRMDVYGRRNDVLFIWYNTPGFRLPIYLLGTTIRGLLFGFRTGRVSAMAQGLAAGYQAILNELRNRAPVRGRTFQLSRRLRQQPMRLDEMIPLLPINGV